MIRNSVFFVSIFAGTRGYIDKVPRNQVTRWEKEFLQFMKEQKSSVRDTLVKDKKMSPDLEKSLREAIETFGKQFKA